MTIAHPRTRTLAWICIGAHTCSPFIASPANSQLLPEPPRPGTLAPQPDHDLYLLLVINQHPSDRLITVRRNGSEYWISRADLGSLILPGQSETTGPVNLSAIDGMHVHYDAPNQRLELSVPPEWIATQQLGSQPPTTFMEAESSPGGALNYRLHAYGSGTGQWESSLWHDARLFGAAGTWRNTGMFRHTTRKHRRARNQTYTRYDTSWQFNDQKRMLTWEAGDIITRTPAWVQSTRLGGVQVSRNFALRPDLITYPLPEFSGMAEVPSSVQLFINGMQRQQYQIGPGPFTLTDLPGISGTGEATVITEDAQGRQVSTTIPFYVTNQLLRPGYSSFSASLGAVRRDFGLRNFSYGTPAASVSWRTGITPWLTLGAHTELSRPHRTGGVSSTLRLWRAGVAEFAVQRSQSNERSGNAYSLAYRYQHQRFNISAQYARQDSGFRSLANALHPRSPTAAAGKRQLQITGGLALGRWGSVGAGYFDLRSPDVSRTRTWNVSWQRSLTPKTHLSVHINRTIGRGWSGTVQLGIVPGRDLGTASLTAQRNQEGNHSYQAHAARSPAISGGWGWHLAVQHAPGTTTHSEASVTQRTRFATWRVSASQQHHQRHYSGELGGSVAFMAGRAFLANEINDGFVVVSTNGIAEVPVLYENQAVGRTDHRGYLLVPLQTAYYPGKYQIDALNIPAGIQVPEVEKKVAVKAQSGYLLQFPLKKTRTANLQLVDAHGEPLPPGSRIQAGADKSFFAGWDGAVYLEGIGEDDQDIRLDVLLPDGRTCRAWLRLPEQTGPTHHLGTITCQ